jgi:hypothetical protein
MKMEYPSIKETASQIMRDILAEERVKQAEQQMLQDVLSPRFKTDLGYTLIKLATQCRELANNTKISYNDLNNFIKQANARRTS